jgi:hypothetical protein
MLAEDFITAFTAQVDRASALLEAHSAQLTALQKAVDTNNKWLEFENHYARLRLNAAAFANMSGHGKVDPPPEPQPEPVPEPVSTAPWHETSISPAPLPAPEPPVDMRPMPSQDLIDDMKRIRALVASRPQARWGGK